MNFSGILDWARCLLGGRDKYGVLGILIGLVVFISTAYANERVDTGDQRWKSVVENLVFDKCLYAMEKDIDFNVEEMTPQPVFQNTTKFIEKVWKHPDLPVFFATSQAVLSHHTYTSCRVYDRRAVPGEFLTNLKLVENSLNNWAAGAIESGMYREIPVCSDKMDGNTRVFESLFQREDNNFLRVVSSIHYHLDMFIFVVGENAHRFSSCDSTANN